MGVSCRSATVKVMFGEVVRIAAVVIRFATVMRLKVFQNGHVAALVLAQWWNADSWFVIARMPFDKPSEDKSNQFGSGISQQRL